MRIGTVSWTFHVKHGSLYVLFQSPKRNIPETSLTPKSANIVTSPSTFLYLPIYLPLSFLLTLKEPIVIVNESLEDGDLIALEEALNALGIEVEDIDAMAVKLKARKDAKGEDLVYEDLFDKEGSVKKL